MALSETDIQVCVDRMDILQLFAKYCHIVDDCTWEKLPEVFAEDAVLEDLEKRRLKVLDEISDRLRRSRS